jgi:hypothetical protein
LGCGNQFYISACFKKKRLKKKAADEFDAQRTIHDPHCSLAYPRFCSSRVHRRFLIFPKERLLQRIIRWQPRHSNASTAVIISANLLVACVTSETDRKNTFAKDKTSAAERLPLYPLEKTQR